MNGVKCNLFSIPYPIGFSLEDRRLFASFCYGYYTNQHVQVWSRLPCFRSSGRNIIKVKQLHGCRERNWHSFRKTRNEGDENESDRMRSLQFP